MAGTDYSRDDLIALCERAVVPMKHWHDRDSASAHEGIGVAWALLRAGAPFNVRTEPKYERDGCVTDDNTIWVSIQWDDFNRFEYGRHPETGVEMAERTFYIPTAGRLDAADGKDWY